MKAEEIKRITIYWCGVASGMGIVALQGTGWAIAWAVAAATVSALLSNWMNRKD